MDAIRLHAFGPPENLVVEQVPDPAPGPGQVLVAASAHGVHLLDATLRRGEDDGPLPLPELPTVPGREVAGTVAAVGPGVDAAWVGRRVVAHLGRTASGGGYARLAVVAVDALHPVPDALALADAVAMVGTGRTAVLVLRAAAVTRQDVVVVTAAAGGLGSLLVQAALEQGARVLALVGAREKVRVVRSLVPDAGERVAAVDTSGPGWQDAARAAVRRLAAGRDRRPGPDGHDGGHGEDADGPGASLVLDGVGGDVGTAAAELLGTGGRLVVHGWAAGSPNRVAAAADGDRAPGGVRVVPVVGPGSAAPADLRPLQAEALERAASGRWRVLTYRVPFAAAARAHRDLEERRTTGKVVLV